VRRIGRGAHHCLVWLGSIAGVLLLLGVVVIWRLMQGPIALDWLAPYVAAGLERSGIGFKVAIGGVRLGIDRATHHLDLWAEDVRLSLPDGVPLARLPEIATSFGLRELLHGQLTPARLVIERPVVRLALDPGGAITARLANPDDTASDLGPQMLKQLAGARQAEAPFGLVQRLSIRGATVIVDDQRTGQSWRAERVDVAVERSGKGIRGDFSLAAPIGSSMPELHAEYRYFADRHVLDLDLSIDGIEPTAIPPLIPELAQLQHLQLPVSGTLRTRIDLDHGSAQGSRLDLVLGKGQVQSEWLPKGVVAVEKGELHAVYAPETSQINLDSLALDLGAGAELVLSGTLGGVTPELIAAARDARPAGLVAGQLNAALKHVPVERLDALWPPALSAGGRRWTLDNVHDGVLDEASASVALDIDPVAHTVKVQSANGALRYHDLTVSYFNGLPPARHVDGTAVFADKRLQFLPTGGALKGLKITGGSLDITELGTALEWLTIDLPISGPLQDALEVIDTKPLSYAHAIGIDPARVSGRADTMLHFKFPLLANLKLEAIEYGAKATMSGVSIGKVAMDRNLTDGSLTLDLGRAGARLQGTARLDGIPAKLDANAAFHPKGGPRAVYRIGLTLDAEARRRLDLDFEGRLSGSFGIDLTYSQLDAVRAQAVATLDMRSASLAIDEAGWKKPADMPATAKLVIDLEHDRITRLPQIEVKAAGLDGRMAITTSDGGKQIERIDMQRLVAGDNDVSGTVTRRPGGGWNADIRAARIDGQHLVKEAASNTGAPSPIPLGVTVQIDRLLLGPHKEIGQVAGEALRSGGAWQSARLDGRLPNGQKLALRLGEGGGRRFSLQSEDLGATLKLLGVADNVIGGRLTINGQFSGAAGKQTLLGHIEGENYSIVGAPVMARILALPSFTGFVSTLSGDGLPFSTLRGDFTYNGGRVTIKNLLTFGESLGITANGWVDTELDRLELEGTVAPAYALNSLLGNIPLLGQLLGGGSQGLFAANYRLSGSSDNPDVSVNPLSVLTPGVLRQLFAPLVGFPSPQSEQQAVTPPQAGDTGSPR
jgi:hypothetical protein